MFILVTIVMNSSPMLYSPNTCLGCLPAKLYVYKQALLNVHRDAIRRAPGMGGGVCVGGASTEPWATVYITAFNLKPLNFPPGWDKRL